MADALESGVCDLIGLGRATVLQPDFPSAVILNPDVPDGKALGIAHVVKGQWLTRMIPVKVIGGGLITQFFYHNMRRLGKGLAVDPNISLPTILFVDALETFRSGLLRSIHRLFIARGDGLEVKAG